MAVPTCALERAVSALSAEAAACVATARATAPRSTVQMGPLDGTWLARLITGMLLWEGAYRVARLLATRHARHAAGTAPAGAASREDRDLWGVLVPSYAVSTLHALLMCWRGALHVTQLWGAPLAEKMVIVPGQAFYAENQGVELSNWAFLSYMCYDLAHVVSVYPRLGGVATVFHHLAFATAALVAGVSRSFPFAFGWLILCEVSTPFLNLRWAFKTVQKRDAAAVARVAARLGYRSQQALEYAIDAVFAFAFISMRVGSYGVGLAQLLYAARHGFLEPLAPSARHTMMALVSAGFLLNMQWVKRLVAGLRRSAERAAAAEQAASH